MARSTASPNERLDLVEEPFVRQRQRPRESGRHLAQHHHDRAARQRP